MRRSVLAALVGGAAFAALTAAVWARWGPVVAFDDTVHRAVINARDGASIEASRWLTNVGSTYIALPILFGAAVLAPRAMHWRGRLASGAVVAGIAAFGAALGLLVNHAVNGVRPDQADWAGAAGGPTFPSGHTTMATLLACGLAWVLAARLDDPRSRRSVWVVAAALALIVGFTRVWLGVHWPSDVMGGWVFGITWFAVALSFARPTARAVDH